MKGLIKLAISNKLVFCYVFLIAFVNSRAETFNFFGYKINLTEEFLAQKLSSKLRVSNGLQVDEIELFLKESKNVGIEKLIINLQSEISKNKMSDFVALELIKAVANKLYKNNAKLKKLITWHLLQEMGYDSLLQFSDNQVIVFCNMNIHFEKISFMDAKNGFYTDISYDTSVYPEKMFNYPPDTIPIGKQIVLNEKTVFKFPANNNVKKAFCFNFNSNKYSLKYKVNKNLVDFLDVLPNIDYLAIYPSSFGISSSAKEEVIKFFRNEVSEFDTLSGIGFLLNFCQEIKYSDDLITWKKEKYLFPEQILFYTTGDCDDKTILMGFLLKEVYQLSTVAITYLSQNHMNLAVKIKPSSTDKTVDFKNAEYVVIEPTGVGLKVGQCKSDLNFSRIEITPLN